MIDRYAQKFSLDPNKVFKSATFDDVTVFLIKWSEESQYADRYNELEKMMQPQQPLK